MTVEAVLCVGPLPISGQKVILRPLTGVEDQLLLEARDNNVSLVLALLNRLARLEDHDTSDIGTRDRWDWLALTDLDVLILRLRQAVLGDRIRADVSCGTTGCNQRIDISFGVDEYIAHHTPVLVPEDDRDWSVEPVEEPGWFRLLEGQVNHKAGIEGESAGSSAPQQPPTPLNLRSGQKDEVFFRIPTAADQLAVAGLPDPAEALVQRCVQPALLAAGKRLQVEMAMESMAPALSNELIGACPECGAEAHIYFEVRDYCLSELRQYAAFIYEDIDVLARRYHWTEADILAMPRNRRMIYAEFARQQGGQ
jgi:hypothetical protein